MGVFDIEQGIKKQYYSLVPGLDVLLPVTVIRGRMAGPNILITAGIHNQEYAGIEAANRLAQELKLENICGCVAIIHVCNPAGFAALAPDIVPEDGLNLNRVFPGGNNGSAAQCIAGFILDEFLGAASCLIDLHCGGFRETLEPHVYFQGMSDKYLENASKRLASLVNVNYMVRATSYTGSLFSTAAKLGIPGILIERGGMAMWSEDDVSAYLSDIRRLLRRLSVIGYSEHQKKAPQKIVRIDHFSADVEGCWYPDSSSGSIIEKGKPLGYIKDIFGQELMRPTAITDCVILYQTVSLSIRRGDFLAACGEIVL